MSRLFTKKGQSTAEYAILIGLVITVAIVMQIYVKRSLQGGAKFAVDKLKDSTGQYEPYYLKSAYNSEVATYEQTEETKAGGEVIRELASESAPQTRTRSGKQQIKDTTYAD